MEREKSETLPSAPSTSSPGPRMTGVAPRSLPSFRDERSNLARSSELANDVYDEGGGDGLDGNLAEVDRLDFVGVVASAEM